MPHWFGKKLWKGTMKYNKAYYCQMYFNQILPQIAEITTQSRFGYHGLSHTNQVALFGIDLAHSINQDALPVMLAAGLHDCARTNDAWCTEHGPRAVLVGRDFLAKNYKNLPESTIRQILYAVGNHTIGRVAPDGVSACLWDADRIRLSWEYEYRPEFFNTARGREIAAFCRDEQRKYIDDQDSFLIRNKIKTREQIDFEREQDKLQNELGTVFCCRQK